MTTRRSGKRRKNLEKSPAQPVGRRDFLKLGAAGLSAASLGGGLLAACSEKKEEPKAAEPAPVATTAPINASAPETPDIRFGMIALTDCSPIVVAHEKGLFKKYGINSTVVKGASWAAIRDSLSNGDIQATHMLIGMPIASTMGLLGSPQVPMIITT
jgi:nitrate/nitrite transport system substrate-binding protein